MPKTQFFRYVCGIMTTYQQNLMILDNFEINFIWALFPPGTAAWHRCYIIGGPNNPPLALELLNCWYAMKKCGHKPLVDYLALGKLNNCCMPWGMLQGGFFKLEPLNIGVIFIFPLFTNNLWACSLGCSIPNTWTEFGYVKTNTGCL